jgi:CubicO group peptidase (beta-lactamase class C family)
MTTTTTSTAAPAISGTCDPAFDRVRDEFVRNFTERGDVGASVAVMVDGELKVDLWGGWADKARSKPWERDTIVATYSTTKGMVALCAHMLADRGELNLDAPVAKYWPEFAQAGKEAMPVRYLLTHQSALPALDTPLPPGSTLDWDAMTTALAAQRPLWEPGTAHGYHTITFGWLIGEVIRRVSGLTPGQYLKKNVCEPLGVDFLLGFGPEEDHRVADMLRPVMEPAATPQSRVEGTLAERSFAIAPPKPGVGVNHREYRAAEIPAGNGHGNGRALATIYGALARGGEVDGVRLLSPEAIARAVKEQVNERDVVLELPVRRSLGFVLPIAEQGDIRGPNAFGHPGMGGSAGFADPDHRLGFGYAMNQMYPSDPSRIDPRAQSLIAATYEALGRR